MFESCSPPRAAAILRSVNRLAPDCGPCGEKADGKKREAWSWARRPKGVMAGEALCGYYSTTD